MLIQCLNACPVVIGIRTMRPYRTLIIGKSTVGDDFVRVEFLSEPKAVAFGTCAEWGIEGEEAWLYLRNRYAAVRAAVLLAVYLTASFIMIFDLNKAICDLKCMLYRIRNPGSVGF